MQALFQEEHRAETDRAADIRAAREEALAVEAEATGEAGTQEPEEQPVPILTDSPTRRAVLTAGLAGDRRESAE